MPTLVNLIFWLNIDLRYSRAEALAASMGSKLLSSALAVSPVLAGVPLAETRLALRISTVGTQDQWTPSWVVVVGTIRTGRQDEC